MNVTLKLPDEIVREARIRAVHNSKSLSAWMGELVRRELASESSTTHPEAPQSLFEAMQVPGMPDWFYEKEFPLPDRKAEREREFHFDPDEA
jgi:plasmid stability protein